MSITNITSMYVFSGINSVLLIANIVLIYFKFKTNNLAIAISSSILLLLLLLLSYSIVMIGVKKMDDIKNELDIKDYKNTTRYRMSLALSIIWGLVFASGFVFLIGAYIKEDD